MFDHHDERQRRWRVALIAHDARKAALSTFVLRHQDAFRDWELLATADTADVLRTTLGARLRAVLPAPRGGDVQIGAEIAAGEVDALIFLRDPLTAESHEPEVGGLLRIADVHTIPVATNLASAECLVRALACPREPLLSPRAPAI